MTISNDRKKEAMKWVTMALGDLVEDRPRGARMSLKWAIEELDYALKEEDEQEQSLSK